MQKRNGGAATLVDSVFEIDKVAEEEIEVQHTPCPHLPVLKKKTTYLPLHSCCQTFDQPPLSQFLQKSLKHNFTFELRENVILEIHLVIFSPNTWNYQNALDLIVSFTVQKSPLRLMTLCIS